MESTKVHVEVNVISYNAVLHACEKAGEWQKTLELLHSMCEQQLQDSSF